LDKPQFIWKIEKTNKHVKLDYVSSQGLDKVNEIWFSIHCVAMIMYSYLASPQSVARYGDLQQKSNQRLNKEGKRALTLIDHRTSSIDVLWSKGFPPLLMISKSKPKIAQSEGFKYNTAPDSKRKKFYTTQINLSFQRTS